MTDEVRFQVFVSSTAQDLKDEREKIWESLVSLDFIVSGMEAFPATSEAQFEYIKRQLALTDYFILVVAGRYGTLSEGGISFTEREFDYAQQLGLPTLVFLHQDIASLPLSRTDRDDGKMAKLLQFRERISKNRLCSHWKTPDELALNAIKAIQAAIKSTPRPGWQRGDRASSSNLLEEIHKTRAENDTLKSQLSEIFLNNTTIDIEQSLKRLVTFSFRNKLRKNHTSIQLNLRAILKEISIFEATSFELFEEALRGAIAVKTDVDYDAIEVDRAETDRAILLLSEMNVVKFIRTRGSLEIVHGDNWIAAHSFVKLVR